MAGITPNQVGFNQYDANIEDQKWQAMQEAIADIEEKLPAIERETEETNARAQSLEKRVDSLNTVSNAALNATLAVGSVLALYILESGVRYIKNRYFN